MARVLMVRHGQSEWNAIGRWQGQADPPLSPLGRQQASDAVPALRRMAASAPWARVVTSDLHRARATAEIMAAGLGLEPITVERGFRERDAGEWSGLTRAEIHEQWPGYLYDDPHRPGQRPRDGSFSERRPPGWESDTSLVERSLAALGRLAGHLDEGGATGPVICVCHGGVVMGLERHLGTDDGRLPNLAGRWVTVDGVGDVALGERVLLVEPEEATVGRPGEV